MASASMAGARRALGSGHTVGTTAFQTRRSDHGPLVERPRCCRRHGGDDDGRFQMYKDNLDLTWLNLVPQSNSIPHLQRLPTLTAQSKHRLIQATIYPSLSLQNPSLASTQHVFSTLPPRRPTRCASAAVPLEACQQRYCQGQVYRHHESRHRCPQPE